MRARACVCGGHQFVLLDNNLEPQQRNKAADKHRARAYQIYHTFYAHTHTNFSPPPKAGFQSTVFFFNVVVAPPALAQAMS